MAALAGTALYDYWFTWGATDKDAGLAAGFGSIYNHSSAANVAYRKDAAAHELEFVAQRDIAAGEELRIDYTGGGDASAPLWFPEQGVPAPTARPERAMAREASVHVGSSGTRGRGVFANRDFAAGDEIEVAPVVVVPGRDWAGVSRTVLDNYCYAWGDRFEHAAFALGCGSFYNHADAPSARFARDHDHRLIGFTAVRAISAGSEITIDYRSSYGEWFPLWFDAR